MIEILLYREAHVIWDNVSGNSKGYGFVAFRDKTDAEQAIATMNGEYLGSRPIRCNWATQKGKVIFGSFSIVYSSSSSQYRTNGYASSIAWSTLTIPNGRQPSTFPCDQCLCW